MNNVNPAIIADAHRRRREEENKTPEQCHEELATAVDELLSRDVHVSEEVELLEQAHRLVNEALGHS
ncbi:hypothetical protein [Corynebacterium anserum]|uniref:Uncharacterized protein n=1 Tax=Corynebacterium anserum TaxID=2684406 RepID=A0A7G7YN74_9CORY|nr:hypothetical protein [Corynebacterium anserum]MBC2681486.1 hypothetical protein [Corynebacterium anserum]QNH95944.1 hypothetical protein GP473_03965 [Corynebacterium anserum]